MIMIETRVEICHQIKTVLKERPCAGNITRVTVQVKSKGIFPGLFFCFKMIKFLLKQSEIRVWEISNLIAQSDQRSKRICLIINKRLSLFQRTGNGEWERERERERVLGNGNGEFTKRGNLKKGEFTKRGNLKKGELLKRGISKRGITKMGNL